MRICDWSSDVCSSDLVETARIARASLAAWWGGGPDFRIDARTFFQAADMAPVGEDIVDLGLLDAERQAAEARIKLAEANGVTDPTVRAGVRHFGQGNEVRSEEHTSELQSLMRISYAVFCLKKKKTKLK